MLYCDYIRYEANTGIKRTAFRILPNPNAKYSLQHLHGHLEGGICGMAYSRPTIINNLAGICRMAQKKPRVDYF